MTIVYVVCVPAAKAVNYTTGASRELGHLCRFVTDDSILAKAYAEKEGGVITELMLNDSVKELAALNHRRRQAMT